MQRGGQKLVGTVETIARRQVNAVGARPIEGPVGLVMADIGAGGLQQSLGTRMWVPIRRLDSSGGRPSICSALKTTAENTLGLSSSTVR
jgi:hypothetical protein